MSRATDLLRAAALTLDTGEDPFTAAFLGENEVTLEEAIRLTHQLAIGARMVAHGLDKPRSQQGVAMIISMAEELH